MKPLIEVPKNVFSCHDTRTPLKCKGIQACLGFQIPRHVFRIPRTEFHSLMVELGFRTPIVTEIPDSKAHDSGFHEQNLSDSGILEQNFSDSGFHEQNFSDSGFLEQYFSDSGFHEQSFSECGIRIPLHGAICSWGCSKGQGTAEPVETDDATQQGYSPSPQMTAHVDLQHFTPNDVHTPDIRSGVHCRLRNGVIGQCVESFTENVDLRLPLCLQRQCTLVTAFSQTSSFLEPRIFKSLKSHKPVCKTYRPESSKSSWCCIINAAF